MRMCVPYYHRVSQLAGCLVIGIDMVQAVNIILGVCNFFPCLQQPLQRIINFGCSVPYKFKNKNKTKFPHIIKSGLHKNIC